MKKNQKAFMLVETLVVTTLVSTTLIFLYVQFNNLTRAMNKAFHYNSTDSLYAVNSIKEIIVSDETFYNSLKQQLSESVNNGVNFLQIYTDCTSTNTSNAFQMNNCTAVSFDEVTNFYNIEKIMFTYDYMDLADSDYNSEFLNNDPNFVSFIKNIKPGNNIVLDEDNNIINFYRLIVEFEGNKFATLKIIN